MFYWTNVLRNKSIYFNFLIMEGFLTVPVYNSANENMLFPNFKFKS